MPPLLDWVPIMFFETHALLFFPPFLPSHFSQWIPSGYHRKIKLKIRNQPIMLSKALGSRIYLIWGGVVKSPKKLNQGLID
jgi:hypothetical protein